jgi:hypothetical protein
VGGPPHEVQRARSMALPASRATYVRTNAATTSSVLPPSSLIGHSLKGIHALIARKSDKAMTTIGATRAAKMYLSIRLPITLTTFDPLFKPRAGQAVSEIELVMHRCTPSCSKELLRLKSAHHAGW